MGDVGACRYLPSLHLLLSLTNAALEDMAVHLCPLYSSSSDRRGRGWDREGHTGSTSWVLGPELGTFPTLPLEPFNFGERGLTHKSRCFSADDETKG